MRGRPRTPEEIARFAKMWNEGVSTAILADEFSTSRVTILSWAYALRSSGTPMIARERGAHLRRRARTAPPRPIERQAGPFPGSVLQPAIVYDAAGKAIGTMDPWTREQRPLVPA